MKCRSVKKRLSAYQDGELGARERDRIETHLERCPVCRNYYGEMQNTWEFLGQLPDIEPNERFYPEFRKKISGLNDRRLIPGLRQVFQLLPSPLAMAALLVAGLVIGTYLGNFFVKQNLIFARPRQPRYSQWDVSLASIRTFDAIPPGTLAHGYMRLVSYTEGEHR